MHGYKLNGENIDSVDLKALLVSLGMRVSLDFRDCRPKASLAKVEQIVGEMRSGTRDTARFWIDLSVPKDGPKHKILIELYALRDPSGRYLGCKECTRDVQDIMALKGQKRLLD